MFDTGARIIQDYGKNKTAPMSMIPSLYVQALGSLSLAKMSMILDGGTY